MRVAIIIWAFVFCATGLAQTDVFVPTKHSPKLSFYKPTKAGFFGGISSSVSRDAKYVSTSITPGFLLAHRADIKNLAAHNFGVEISYEKGMAQSRWGQFYKKPTIGYGLMYYNLGKEQTGHALGVLIHTKLGLVSLGQTNMNFRMGAGLAYLTKKFDVYTNRRNQAIGSHLNGSMQFGLTAQRWFKNRSSYLEGGLSISHYSNAAYKVPNLGYNIPSVTIRYGARIGPVLNYALNDTTGINKYDWRATAFYGKKQRNFASPRDFYNFGLQLRGIRNINSVKAFRFGLDYTLDKTYKYSEDVFYPLDSVSLKDQSELAVSAGFQWTFASVDIIAEIGAYLYKPAVLKNPLNQRLGLNYNFYKNWSTQGTLRFHRGVADFFEIGVGYTL